ncbi:MAG: exonuclease SbcCD subunit D C-terminal domain-containing protein [Muribaculaceae bacterium]|nr:exonuclease SbcCD subunit D C-terminal domain-containing protein [Muribaculaceae bacterium]
MFRFIHTSDWHLGQNFYGYDRSEEQRDFLRQLALIVRQHEPDALLVSGDIFHTAAPSSAAVNLYVDAMLDIHNACPGMAIIVIAGNHDSAARLESDKRLWELAGVQVLGGISRDNDGKADLDRHIIRVAGKGTVAAVPFAYPASFPLAPDATDIERSQRQQAYFQALLDRANEDNQGLPVVLMAHLAVSHSDITGHDPNMMMECVDISTLGQGYDYAALGHIHRPQMVDDHTRYCGTPIPVSFDEQCEHSVSIVEIDAHGSTPRWSTQVIKNLKPLHTIPAKDPVPFEQALELLQKLDPNEQSYIRVNVQVDTYLPTGAQEQAAMALQDKQCRFCEIKKTVTAMAQTRRDRNISLEAFNAMSPIEIARMYFIDKNGREMSGQQEEMFNYIYQLVQEENRQ